MLGMISKVCGPVVRPLARVERSSFAGFAGSDGFHWSRKLPRTETVQVVPSGQGLPLRAVFINGAIMKHSGWMTRRPDWETKRSFALPEPSGPVTEPCTSQAKSVRNHLTDLTNERVWALHCHAEGFLVGCVGGQKGQLIFWNETEEKPFYVFALPNTARGMSVHSDGIQIATAHADSKLRITKLAAKA